MSTNINTAKSGSSYPPLDAGTYSAVCCGVIDLGLQRTEWEGQVRETSQILLSWEFPGETIEYNGETRPRQMSETYTFSMNEKAKLRTTLASWRGRDFTDDEMSDFNVNRLLGVPCVITVTQRTNRNGQPSAKIAAIGKLMKGVTVPPPSKKLHFDIDDESTWPTFAELPEWIQTRINGSLTFQRAGIQLDKDGRTIKSLQASVMGTTAQGMADVAMEMDINDEDLPF